MWACWYRPSFILVPEPLAATTTVRYILEISQPHTTAIPGNQLSHQCCVTSDPQEPVEAAAVAVADAAAELASCHLRGQTS